MDAKDSSKLPLGETVEAIRTPTSPPKKLYSGEFVALRPVEPEKDVDELFLNSHGSHVKEQIWAYMAYGPFSKKEDMLNWLMRCKASTDMIFFTVNLRGRRKRLS